MAKLVSGKVKKTSPTQVSADRYNFISLDQVEPDLGVPDASGKVLSSTTAGVRSWINPTSLSVTSPIINSGNASIGQYIIGFDQTFLDTKANLSGATFSPVDTASSAVNILGKSLTATVVSATAGTNDVTFSTGSAAHGFSVGQFVTFPSTVSGGSYAPYTNYGSPLPIISVTTYTFTVGFRKGTGSYSGETVTAVVYQSNSIFKVTDSAGNIAAAITPDGTLTVTNNTRPDLPALNVVTNTGQSPNSFAITGIASSSSGSSYAWAITAPGHNIVANEFVQISFVTSTPTGVFNGTFLVNSIDNRDNRINILNVPNGTYVSGGDLKVIPLAVSVRSNTGSSFSISSTSGLLPFVINAAKNSASSLTVQESGTPSLNPAQAWYDYSYNGIGGVSSVYGQYLGTLSSAATPTNYWRLSDGLTINGTNVINASGVFTGIANFSNTTATVRLASTANISEILYTYGGGTSSSVSGTSGNNQLTVTGPTFVIAVGQIVTGTGISGTVTVTAVAGTDPYTVTLSSNLSATASGSYSFLGADGGTGVGNYFRCTSTTIDGVSVAVSDRILLKNQTSGIVNGIYYVSQISGGTTVYLTRATDADNSALGELATGKRVFVTEGTANGGTSWVLSSRGTATNSTVKINTDSITFTPVTSPATVAPIVDGTAAVGTSLLYARQDHVHPTDTTRAPLASPALTGTPTVPTATADTNTTQAASTAFVLGQAGTATPLINGTAAVGTSTSFARQDHVHPSDTTRAALSGATFTGTVSLNTTASSSATITGISVNDSGYAWTISAPGIVASANQYVTISGVTPSSFNGTYLVSSATTNQVTLNNVQAAITYTSGGTITVNNYSFQSQIGANTLPKFGVTTSGLVSPLSISSPKNYFSPALKVTESDIDYSGNYTQIAQEWYAYNNTAIAGVSSNNGVYLGSITATGNGPVSAWSLSEGLRINSKVVVDSSGNITGNLRPVSGGVVVNGGTSSQFLKADGSRDSTAYAPLASPSFTTPSLGVATATSINGTTIPSSATLYSSTSTVSTATTSTAASGVGYMGLPQNATTTGSYTIVAGDAGTHIYASATRTVTIPANSSVAFPIGTTLTFIAGTGATMTIAITTDTMYLAGAGTTGSRTLAAFGMATAVKITSTSWMISGNGLT